MIYLDYASTTPCAAEVIDAMLPFFRESFANASSIDHIPGNAAFRAVESARESIAELMGVRSDEVIFTSGSTESNNLAVSVTRRVITTPIEHPSILDPMTARDNPHDVKIAVDRNGLVILDSLREALGNGDSALVTVIATNNETGSEQNCDAIAQVVREYGGLLHIDATQSVGLQSFDLRKSAIDGASISAHKINGPKGIGALIARGGLRKTIRPLTRGGGHERGLRSGTLNVAAIVGFGVAARLALTHHRVNRERISVVRRAFFDTLVLKLDTTVNQTIEPERASPHILSLRIKGINGRALLGEVKNEIAFSLGSACATLKSEPSHVLLALGVEKQKISQTIRISFSAEQSVEQAQRAANIIATAAMALQKYSEAV